MNLIRAERLARSLMWEYGLIPNGWDFAWNRQVGVFGLCHYERYTIYLSKVLTPQLTVAQTENIIRHEIAHALVGPSHGHDEVWRHQARLIGCTGNTTEAYKAVVKPKWQAKCPVGNHLVGRPRHRRVLKNSPVCSKHRRPVTWASLIGE
ncbi:SprT-like protease [Streptomyces phage Tomas]|uniref:SprT-like protease n=1 Tax=Streptomyces phage Tomas TaxID=2914443 RepID=A0AA49BTZ7_9CAUD|nr:SprT-like protease [Streptomyces phage Tomas]UMO76361.1 SprT-like protease [Streptomyces phage Tomas]